MVLVPQFGRLVELTAEAEAQGEVQEVQTRGEMMNLDELVRDDGAGEAETTGTEMEETAMAVAVMVAAVTGKDAAGMAVVQREDGEVTTRRSARQSSAHYHSSK